MTVIIESAIELEDAHIESLTKLFQKAYDKKTILEFRVDPDLIGGIRVVLPHKTIDMTLSAKLSQLTKALQKVE